MTAALLRAGSVFTWQARAYRRTWRATITIAFLNPLFFLLAVGVVLGHLVDRARPDLGGLTYLQFVAPGLLAASAMQIGTNEASFPILAGMRWSRTYHAAAATPLRVPELVGGIFCWVAARILAAAAIFTCIAAAFGAFRSPLAAAAPLAALLCGLAFAAPIAAFAAGRESHFGLTGIFRFVILPLFLFSGSFFPVSRLPGALEWIAWLTPLWHGVTLCRDLATGRAELLASLGHAAYLLALIALGTVLAVRVMERRLLR